MCAIAVRQGSLKREKIGETIMRPTGIYLVVAAVLATGTAGCTSDSGPERASAAEPVRSPAPVTSPAPSAVQREIPAVLTVEHEVDVLAEHDGVVLEMLADEGAKVESGAILARLDSREVESQLEQARADFKISEFNVKYNEAELHANQARLERAQMMFNEGLGSKADLDEAEFRAKGSAYDLESWKAQVEKRRAQVRALDLELDRTRIRAPFAGVVSRRYLRQGEMVSKGTPCYRLSQLGPLLVEFQVPETDANKPAAEQTVHGTLLSDPNRSFEARIVRVSPVVDAASGSYQVTASLVAPGTDLKPGMAVRVSWAENPARP
jgi:membrane fusion protein (multidrug efflux system)